MVNRLKYKITCLHEPNIFTFYHERKSEENPLNKVNKGNESRSDFTIFTFGSDLGKLWKTNAYVTTIVGNVSNRLQKYGTFIGGE